MFHAVFLTLARFMALAGGAVLGALVVMTCASIAGRHISAALNSNAAQASFPGLADWLLARGIGPVTGDFELIEMGMGFAIFAFLPLCQISAAHARVDVFTARLPDQANRILRALTEAAFAGVLVLMAWQLALGTGARMRSGQSSFLLAIPLWWAYGAALVGACVAALSGIYMSVMRLREVAAHRDLLPEQEPEF